MKVCVLLAISLLVVSSADALLTENKANEMVENCTDRTKNISGRIKSVSRKRPKTTRRN